MCTVSLYLVNNCWSWLEDVGDCFSLYRGNNLSSSIGTNLLGMVVGGLTCSEHTITLDDSGLALVSFWTYHTQPVGCVRSLGTHVVRETQAVKQFGSSSLWTFLHEMKRWERQAVEGKGQAQALSMTSPLVLLLALDGGLQVTAGFCHLKKGLVNSSPQMMHGCWSCPFLRIQVVCSMRLGWNCLWNCHCSTGIAKLLPLLKPCTGPLWSPFHNTGVATCRSQHKTVPLGETLLVWCRRCNKTCSFLMIVVARVFRKA